MDCDGTHLPAGATGAPAAFSGVGFGLALAIAIALGVVAASNLLRVRADTNRTNRFYR